MEPNPTKDMFRQMLNTTNDTTKAVDEFLKVRRRR